MPTGFDPTGHFCGLPSLYLARVISFNIGAAPSTTERDTCISLTVGARRPARKAR